MSGLAQRAAASTRDTTSVPGHRWVRARPAPWCLSREASRLVLSVYRCAARGGQNPSLILEFAKPVARAGRARCGSIPWFPRARFLARRGPATRDVRTLERRVARSEERRVGKE